MTQEEDSAAKLVEELLNSSRESAALGESSSVGIDLSAADSEAATLVLVEELAETNPAAGDELFSGEMNDSQTDRINLDESLFFNTADPADSAQLPTQELVDANTPTVSATSGASPIFSTEQTGQRTGTKPVIVFDHVSKVYPAQANRPALANVSLEVYAGEFLFLVGHSGSGKSTFIRLLNREIRATSGTIMVAGENLTKMHRWRVPYLRRNIGCVFQDYKLLPDKTAYQNVAFALEVIGKSRHIIRTQVPEVLRLVGLEDKLNMLPDQLSGGEQQRVCIARAIVNRPPLLVCDEPTGNLDPQTSLGIMRLLDRINRTGTTVLVATHDREMVDSLRKRVVALENGYLVRDQDRGVYGIDA